MDGRSLLSASNHTRRTASSDEESSDDSEENMRPRRWELQNERQMEVLQLINDDRVLERIHRTTTRVCPCFKTSVYREHIRVPVDSITSMEAAYGQQAKTGRALAAILLCVMGVVVLVIGSQVDELSEFQSRDKIIFTWAGWATLLIAGCLMCSYLNSMKGGMIARFHCVDRDQPIEMVFPLENKLIVSDDTFDAEGDAAGIAMRVVREVEIARAKWHKLYSSSGAGVATVRP